MPDLVHLGQCPLLHLLKGDDFLRILLARKVDFSVPALSDLHNNMKSIQSKLCSTLSEQCTLSSSIASPLLLVRFATELPLGGIFLEELQSPPTRSDVRDQVKVVAANVVQSRKRVFSPMKAQLTRGSLHNKMTHGSAQATLTGYKYTYTAAQHQLYA